MISEEQYRDYLAGLLSGRRMECTSIVKGLLEQGIPIEELYMGLYQRSMYEVGRLWERNRISVAIEHMATSITESLLPLSYPVLFATPRNHRKAIVSCSVNEYHQIGAKMVADILEMKGWDTHFFGANTPGDAMLQDIGDFKPDVVCLSLSVYHHLADMLQVLRDLRAAYPLVPVLVGGQAFLHGGADAVSQIPNVTHLTSILDVEKALA